jgi:hypothetical protein
MTNVKLMRGGAAMIAIAAALLVQGCTMPDSNMSAAAYSGADYAAALDNVMTTDSGGGD